MIEYQDTWQLAYRLTTEVRLEWWLGWSLINGELMMYQTGYHGHLILMSLCVDGRPQSY